MGDDEVLQFVEFGLLDLSAPGGGVGSFGDGADGAVGIGEDGLELAGFGFIGDEGVAIEPLDGVEEGIIDAARKIWRNLGGLGAGLAWGLDGKQSTEGDESKGEEENLFHNMRLVYKCYLRAGWKFCPREKLGFLKVKLGP